jgi:hypothetical protein
LTVPKEVGEERRPQLLIVEPREDDYSDVSTDLLSVRGFESYRPADYHLEYLLEDQVCFRNRWKVDEESFCLKCRRGLVLSD